jgi:hypothetical protein
MNLRRSSLAASIALLLTSCATTGLAESWVEPSLTELPRFEKVFVAYLGVDPASQRKAEDALARNFEQAVVVKSYELFPDARELDAARMKEAVRAAGCDGAVVMRLARIEQEVSFTPGAYPAHYRSFGGYWGYAHAYPPEVYTDEIVHVETNVYSIATDELLYAARSETFNPSSSERLIEEIVAAITDDLEEKGFAPRAR